MTDAEWTHRLTDRCPWSDRVGLRARLVTPDEAEGPGIYPFDKPLGAYRVVLIENDPLRHSANRGWSCVLHADMMEVL